MRAPVRMLDGRGVIVVVILMLGQVDMRRRQHRGKHDGRNEQRRRGGPAYPVGDHAEILSGEMNNVSLSVLIMELHFDLTRDLTRVGVVRSRKRVLEAGQKQRVR